MGWTDQGLDTGLAVSDAAWASTQRPPMLAKTMQRALARSLKPRRLSYLQM
jgi:hypothetical protein